MLTRAWVALCGRRAKKKDVEQSYENGRKTLPAAKVSLKKFEGKAGEVRGPPSSRTARPGTSSHERNVLTSIVYLCVACVCVFTCVADLFCARVLQMLWEVDDDTKGYLTPTDFKSSYYRIRASTEADEPRSWFRLVEFMMIDVDGGGSIDFDEAAVMFRAQPTPPKNTPMSAVMVA